MNWALVASCVLALPLVCMFPEEYKRTNIDTIFSADVDVTTDVKINTADNSHQPMESTVEGINCQTDQEKTEKILFPV